RLQGDEKPPHRSRCGGVSADQRALRCVPVTRRLPLAIGSPRTARESSRSQSKIARRCRNVLKTGGSILTGLNAQLSGVICSTHAPSTRGIGSAEPSGAMTSSALAYADIWSATSGYVLREVFQSAITTAG